MHYTIIPHYIYLSKGSFVHAKVNSKYIGGFLIGSSLIYQETKKLLNKIENHLDREEICPVIHPELLGKT